MRLTAKIMWSVSAILFCLACLLPFYWDCDDIAYAFYCVGQTLHMETEIRQSPKDANGQSHIWVALNGVDILRNDNPEYMVVSLAHLKACIAYDK